MKTIEQAVKAIEFRLAQLRPTLEVFEKNPQVSPATIEFYESRIDELETLLEYIKE